MKRRAKADCGLNMNSRQSNTSGSIWLQITPRFNQRPITQSSGKRCRIWITLRSIFRREPIEVRKPPSRDYCAEHDQASPSTAISKSMGRLSTNKPARSAARASCRNDADHLIDRAATIAGSRSGTRPRQPRSASTKRIGREGRRTCGACEMPPLPPQKSLEQQRFGRF